MREVPFSIPVSGVVRIDGDVVTITVNKAETTVSLGPEIRPGRRISLEPGKTMFDIILGAAHEVIRRKGFNRFSTAELYQAAVEKYTELKRGSFWSRVIACTPNHPSYRHHTSRRDYFSRIGAGLYELNDRYRVDKTSDKERTPFDR